MLKRPGSAGRGGPGAARAPAPAGTATCSAEHRPAPSGGRARAPSQEGVHELTLTISAHELTSICDMLPLGRIADCIYEHQPDFSPTIFDSFFLIEKIMVTIHLIVPMVCYRVLFICFRVIDWTGLHLFLSNNASGQGGQGQGAHGHCLPAAERKKRSAPRGCVRLQ